MDIVHLARICGRWKFICGVSPTAEVIIIEPGVEFPFKEYKLCMYAELPEMTDLEVEMFILGVVFK